MSEALEITPQPGPQTDFLSSQADIVIYGGAAYGGKTYGLLLDPLRHYDNKYFEGVIFRRTSTQIRNTGGLWDTSRKIYGMLGGIPHETYLKWRFPSEFSMRMAGLEYDSSVLDWQGSQIPWIGFDELTHFTEYQFFYMMSRNRSQAGVPGRIRATTNPDKESWVRKLIDWWIKGEDYPEHERGFPIPERSGKLRWFVRRQDDFIWGNSKEEIYEKAGRGDEVLPKSLTFIPARLEDNKIGNEEDPTYKATLLSLGYVETERLYRGNWDVIPQGGMIFNRDWFEIIDAIPAKWKSIIRFWDRAATKPDSKKSMPDWTRGLKMYSYPDGTFLVGDLRSLQDKPLKVEQLIKTVATQDGFGCKIMAQQDPGSAGVEEAANFIKLLAGYQVRTQPFFKDKATRARAVSSQAQAGNIKLLRGPWNEDFLKEVHAFKGDPNQTDDIVDALSGAYNELIGGPAPYSKESVAALGRIMNGR